LVENQPKILPILTADMAISYLFSPAIYGRVLPGHFMVQSFIYYKSPNVSMGLFSRCRHDNAYVIPHLPARRLPAICVAGLSGGMRNPKYLTPNLLGLFVPFASFPAGYTFLQ